MVPEDHSLPANDDPGRWQPPEPADEELEEETTGRDEEDWEDAQSRAIFEELQRRKPK